VKQAPVIFNDKVHQGFHQPAASPVNLEEKLLRIGCRKEG
jgi:hypothetical protein